MGANLELKTWRGQWRLEGGQKRGLTMETAFKGLEEGYSYY